MYFESTSEYWNFLKHFFQVQNASQTEKISIFFTSKMIED